MTILPKPFPKMAATTAATAPAAVPAAAPAAPAPTAADHPEAAAAARRQIEFYFGDANFRRDRFLRAEAEKDADGFVALSTLASFARMRTVLSAVKAPEGGDAAAAQVAFLAGVLRAGGDAVIVVDEARTRVEPPPFPPLSPAASQPSYAIVAS